MPVKANTVPAHLEARLYLLRALSPRSMLRRVFAAPHRSEGLLQFLQIDPARCQQRKELISLRTEIRLRLENLEKRWLRRESDALDSALSDLQSRLGLSPVERAAMRLAVLSYQFEALREGLDGLTRGLASRVRLLATVLACSEKESASVLNSGSVLHRAGWLDLPMVGSGLGECLRLQYEAGELLLGPHPDALGLLRPFCSQVPFGWRSRADFQQVREIFDVLAALLHAALRGRHVGINVLVHAKEAVGKSSLVREVAHAAEVMMYEIPGGSAEGEPWSGAERLTALVRSQRVFGTLEHALLVDDADTMFAGQREPAPLKWWHEQLENNPRPVFWIVRDVRCVPASVLDRFALVVGLPEVVPKGKAIQAGRESIELHPEAAPDWTGASLGQLDRAFAMAGLLNPVLQYRRRPHHGWFRGSGRRAPESNLTDDQIWTEILGTIPLEAPERRQVLSTAALHLALSARHVPPSLNSGARIAVDTGEVRS